MSVSSRRVNMQMMPLVLHELNPWLRQCVFLSGCVRRDEWMKTEETGRDGREKTGRRSRVYQPGGGRYWEAWRRIMNKVRKTLLCKTGNDTGYVLSCSPCLCAPALACKWQRCRGKLTLPRYKFQPSVFCGNQEIEAVCLDQGPGPWPLSDPSTVDSQNLMVSQIHFIEKNMISLFHNCSRIVSFKSTLFVCQSVNDLDRVSKISVPVKFFHICLPQNHKLLCGLLGFRVTEQHKAMHHFPSLSTGPQLDFRTGLWIVSF